MNIDHTDHAMKMIDDFAATFRSMIETSQEVQRKTLEGVKAELQKAVDAIDRTIAEIPGGEKRGQAIMTDDFTALREAIAAGPTPGPYEADSIDNCGEYGTGDDTSSGYKSYALISAKGAIADSVSADFGEVAVEYDEDGCHAWDEVARKNFEFIAAACNAAPALLAKLDRYKKALREIAAYDDNYGNEHLSRCGSYSLFDEPGSVEIARNALEDKTP